MAKKLYVARQPPSQISLDDWLQYISSSPILRKAQPRSGINPFTKKPTEFKPALGAAVFTTGFGECSIVFHLGVLSAEVSDPEAMGLIEQIAADLNATVSESPG